VGGSGGSAASGGGRPGASIVVNPSDRPTLLDRLAAITDRF
jgi:hypothetical protein